MPQPITLPHAPRRVMLIKLIQILKVPIHVEMLFENDSEENVLFVVLARNNVSVFHRLDNGVN
jgi:hypothetical protein